MIHLFYTNLHKIDWFSPIRNRSHDVFSRARGLARRLLKDPRSRGGARLSLSYTCTTPRPSARSHGTFSLQVARTRRLRHARSGAHRCDLCAFEKILSRPDLLRRLACNSGVITGGKKGTSPHLMVPRIDQNDLPRITMLGQSARFAAGAVSLFGCKCRLAFFCVLMGRRRLCSTCPIYAVDSICFRRSWTAAITSFSRAA